MQGAFYEVTTKGFKGWCWNEENNTAERVTIKIFRGKRCIKIVNATASLFKKELKDKGIGNGYHAFDRAYSLKPYGNGVYEVGLYTENGQQLDMLTVIVDIPKNKYFKYVTEDGDTSTSIAQKFLSDAKYAKVIRDINNVPDDICEGTEILIPLDWE